MAPPGASAPVNGTAGSEADPLARYFPAVPFDRQDFHQSCSIQNYSNATEVRVCELASLPDLDQGNSKVRDKIVEFLNHLIDLGVAGFRMDACKHMLPTDLRVIYGRIKSLSTENGFIANTRPFFFQEVIDMGNESVKRQEYTSLGTVTEFTYSAQIGMVFRKLERDLSALQKWGPQSGFLPTRYSFVFVDNHDNQRGHGSGGSMILNYKEKNLYTKAVAFMLAHPHGGNHPRVMSSFDFSDSSQGPPHDEDGNIVSRGVDEQNQCTNGWVCEHRWNPIANMVKFRAATDGTLVRFFTNIAKDQISFCRGNKGLVVINNSERDLSATVNACVPDGFYCDVISGDVVDGRCSGLTVSVTNGKAKVEVSKDSAGVLAIHVDAVMNVLMVSSKKLKTVEPINFPQQNKISIVEVGAINSDEESQESAESPEVDSEESPEVDSEESPESPESLESLESPEVDSEESAESPESLESPESPEVDSEESAESLESLESPESPEVDSEESAESPETDSTESPESPESEEDNPEDDLENPETSDGK
jgi:alpha-amylase